MSDINPILYRLEKEGKVKKDSSEPPRWTSCELERSSLDELESLAKTFGGTVIISQTSVSLPDGVRFTATVSWNHGSVNVVGMTARPRRYLEDAKVSAAHKALEIISSRTDLPADLSRAAREKYQLGFTRGNEQNTLVFIHILLIHSFYLGLEYRVGERWPFPEESFHEYKGAPEDNLSSSVEESLWTYMSFKRSFNNYAGRHLVACANTAQILSKSGIGSIVFGVSDHSRTIHGVWTEIDSIEKKLEDRTAKVNHIQDELFRVLREQFSRFFEPKSFRDAICESIALTVTEISSSSALMSKYLIFIVQVSIDLAKIPAARPLFEWKNETVRRDGAATVVIPKCEPQKKDLPTEKLLVEKEPPLEKIEKLVPRNDSAASPPASSSSPSPKPKTPTLPPNFSKPAKKHTKK